MTAIPWDLRLSLSSLHLAGRFEGREREYGRLYGKFEGPGLGMAYITFARIPPARTQSAHNGEEVHEMERSCGQKRAW